MSLEKRVLAVENLFQQLEQESTLFKQASNIHCLSACGKCCSYANIEASPLEFLPWAFHLFLEGEAENTLQKLKSNHNGTCLLYKHLCTQNVSHCDNYKYRGLICRLFGCAANRDKNGQIRLITCKLIKEQQHEEYTAAQKSITQDLKVPIFTDYYMLLNQIDFHLGNMILPINKALKTSLEEVLQYYAYRPLPYLVHHQHPA